MLVIYTKVYSLVRVFEIEIWRVDRRDVKGVGGRACSCSLYGIKRGLRGKDGRRCRCYVKDKKHRKELNLEEIEAARTLGGTETGCVKGRGKWRGCGCYFTVRHT